MRCFNLPIGVKDLVAQTNQDGFDPSKAACFIISVLVCRSGINANPVQLYRYNYDYGLSVCAFCIFDDHSHNVNIV